MRTAHHLICSLNKRLKINFCRVGWVQLICSLLLFFVDYKLNQRVYFYKGKIPFNGVPIRIVGEQKYKCKKVRIAFNLLTFIGPLSVAGHEPLYKNSTKIQRITPYITGNIKMTLYNSRLLYRPVLERRLEDSL